jgi:hypothetical protein
MLELHASKWHPCSSEGRGCCQQHLLTRLREGQGLRHELEANLAVAMIKYGHGAPVEAIRAGDVEWAPIAVRCQLYHVSARPFVTEEGEVCYDPVNAIVTVVGDDDHCNLRDTRGL